jgi:hypothetical protein
MATEGEALCPNSPIVSPRIDTERTGFRDTVAFRTYGGRLDPDRSSAEQLYAKALLQEQGFDGPPHIVSARELDRYVLAGERELFRGVSRVDYAHELRAGALFVGRGPLGGGIYTISGLDALEHARDYAVEPDGVVLRMSLKAGAESIDAVLLADELTVEQNRQLAQLRADRSQAIRSAWEHGGRAEVGRVEAWMMIVR